MTNAIAGTMSDIATLMVESAVAALTDAAGAPVSADGAAIVESIEPAAYADGAAARSMLTGRAPGGLVTLVPAAGLALDGGHAVGATALIDALARGAAAALSRVTGASFEAAPAEALSAEPSIAGLAVHIIRFSLGTGTAPPVPVHWVVEASLDALITPEDPVIPGEAAASSVAPAGLPELGASAPPGAAKNVQLLSDVQLNVTVELGRAIMQVRDLLSLREGSIVELDRAAGAAVDVLVNGTLVARGEVVVIDDDLGVRVTELIER